MVNYKRENETFFSGINIVPFTDIILVLLVVFMIATPGILNSGLNVSLPGASSARSQLPARVTITLDRGGRVYINNNIVSNETLRLKVMELTAKKKNTGFVLNADTVAQHGKVIEILDLLRKSGARRIYVGAIKK